MTQETKINYGTMVDPERLYPVSYVYNQDRTKEYYLTFLPGRDLTENQIKEWLHFKSQPPTQYPVNVDEAAKAKYPLHHPPEHTMAMTANLFMEELQKAFKAGWQANKLPQNKWVKASERLPKELYKVHWRDVRTKEPILGSRAYSFAVSGDKSDLVEWLDESTHEG